MVNSVPERLVAFNVYQDGMNTLIGVADLQLPSFENLTETVKGAGIAGEYDSPTIGQFQSLMLTLNWRNTTRHTASTLAQRSQRLDCRGSIQTLDGASGNYKQSPMRVVVQGPPKKVDLGKFEVGATMDSSTDIEALYIKVDIDGRNVIEIDKLNYICKVDGVDYLAEVRSALGWN